MIKSQLQNSIFNIKQKEVYSHIIDDIYSHNLDNDDDMFYNIDSVYELSSYVDIWNTPIHNIYEDEVSEDDIRFKLDACEVLKDKYSKMYDIIVTLSYHKKTVKKNKRKKIIINNGKNIV